MEQRCSGRRQENSVSFCVVRGGRGARESIGINGCRVLWKWATETSVANTSNRLGTELATWKRSVYASPEVRPGRRGAGKVCKLSRR